MRDLRGEMTLPEPVHGAGVIHSSTSSPTSLSNGVGGIVQPRLSLTGLPTGDAGLQSLVGDLAAFFAAADNARGEACSLASKLTPFLFLRTAAMQSDIEMLRQLHQITQSFDVSHTFS